MKNKVLKLCFLLFVSFGICFTSCQKETIHEEEQASQTTEVDQSFQEVLDEMDLSSEDYEKFLKTPITHEILSSEANNGNALSAERTDDSFCCEIYSHEFNQNNSGGPCWYNSQYSYLANDTKNIHVKVIQNQVIGNDVITYVLAEGGYRPANEGCFGSSVAIPFQVLDLDGFNYVITNMWIYDSSGVCAHLSDTAELPCP